MNRPFDARLAQLAQITDAVGAFCLAHFQTGAQAETKGPADYVSAVDRQAETLARRLISDAYPSDAILGEEQGGAPSPDAWVIDPVDGTVNFLSGLPYWAVSIAVLRGGQPVMGAVALPALSVLAWGAADGPLHVTGPLPARSPGAALAFGTGRNRIWPEPDRRALEQQAEAEGYHITSLGSCAASLTMVALGRMAGYVEHGTNIWDCAAGVALCRAAGIAAQITPLSCGRVRVSAGYMPDENAFGGH
ncbi:inositol monophosphatase family protein [Paracoccus sp. (in: a-proteobacteria)]|uniref:inositol monophosphatase family protein n=1 Tax=Paracoccus sp. TaxID=267 RepID=UPI0026E07E8D|nr:inositol monophosphatase family protein [Paracoccus sp. (in: a-proteobacteria)]MDO5648797.1 inositol monophosphatase family protein [Paracoccus sp. (in: a-proteobacteria)]